MNVIIKLKNTQNKIKEKINLFIEIIALHILFLFGIGITYVLATIVKKKFTDKSYLSSSWEKNKSSNNPQKMY